MFQYLHRNNISELCRDHFSFSPKVHVGEFLEARECGTDNVSRSVCYEVWEGCTDNVSRSVCYEVWEGGTDNMSKSVGYEVWEGCL